MGAGYASQKLNHAVAVLQARVDRVGLTGPEAEGYRLGRLFHRLLLAGRRDRAEAVRAAAEAAEPPTPQCFQDMVSLARMKNLREWHP